MTIEVINGYYTGLLIPEVRDSGLPRYQLSQKMLSMDQIKSILDDPSRVAARMRFPSNQWIVNQGQVGSCNGMSCAKALQRARVIQGMGFVALSGEGAYAQMNGGRDQGSALSAGMKVMLENGIPPESMVPRFQWRWSAISQEAKDARVRFKAAECYAIESEMELASAIAMGFMCVIAVHASGNYSSLDSDGVSRQSLGSGNHSVGAQDVRIRNGELQFDSFNSWGSNWGQGGCNWVTWKRHLSSTIRYHQFFAVRAAHDDPQGNNPPQVK